MRGFFNSVSDGGFTLLELLVSLGVFGILSGIAASNLKDMDDPLQDGASTLLSFVKQARSKAISTTSAYTVLPQNGGRIITKYAANCEDLAPIEDSTLALELPSGVSLSDTSWFFCFNARGMADSNVEIGLTDADGLHKTVEVLLGGAARIQ